MWRNGKTRISFEPFIIDSTIQGQVSAATMCYRHFDAYLKFNVTFLPFASLFQSKLMSWRCWCMDITLFCEYLFIFMVLSVCFSFVFRSWKNATIKLLLVFHFSCLNDELSIILCGKKPFFLSKSRDSIWAQNGFSMLSYCVGGESRNRFADIWCEKESQPAVALHKKASPGVA